MTTDSTARRPSLKERATIGGAALALLVLNAAMTALAYLATLEGVDAGLGFVVFVIYVTLPLVCVSLILGVIGVIRNRGRLYGIIAGDISAFVLGWAIYLFFELRAG